MRDPQMKIEDTSITQHYGILYKQLMVKIIINLKIFLIAKVNLEELSITKLLDDC